MRITIESRRSPNTGFSPSKKARILMLAITPVAALLGASHAFAAADTWTGGGSSGNWSDTGNWTPGAPVTGDSLIFDGTTNTTATNDFTFTYGNTGGPAFSGLTFASTAGSFTLNGNSFVLAGDINDNSTNAQTIALTTGGVVGPNYGLVLNGGTTNVNVVAGGSLSLGQVTFGNNPPYINNTTASAAQSNTVSTLNFTSNGATLGNLIVQTNTSSNNTMTIASGVTLNQSGSPINGAIVQIGTPPILTTNSSDITNLVVSGAGTWNITGGSANFVVGVGSGNNSTTGFNATLDASGLANFNFTSTGNFLVGMGTRSTATARFAVNSNITAANMIVGDTSQTTGFTANPPFGTNNNNGGTCNVFLGTGTNNLVISGNIIIGNTKGVGALQFADPSLGSVLIAGSADGSTPTANITVGRESSGSGSTGTSSLLLAGHNATVNATILNVGVNGGSTSSATGVATFDQGNMTLGTLQIGLHNSGSGSVFGTFTLGGSSPNTTSTAILNVNTAFNLVNQTTAGAGGTGTFTINGGTANINADLNDASTAGTTTTTINLAGGTLNMMGHAIGSNGRAITNVNLLAAGGSATLSNLGGTGINGAGLVMSGAGTLQLAGSNTYSGDTTINTGIVSVVGSITGGGNVNVAPAGKLIGSGDGSSTGVMGNVVLNGGTIYPGTVAGDIGKLTMSGLTIHTGAVNIDLGPSFTSDLLNDTGALTLGDSPSSNLNLILSGTSPAVGTYEIIDYAGALTKNADFTVSGPLGFNYALDYGTAGKVLLNVTVNANVVTWNGAADQTTWDTSHLNFTNGSSNVAYSDPNPVIFNDSAPSSATTITLVGTLSPSTVSVNSTQNYTFTGAGSIGGSGNLIKDGPSTLTVLNSNSYSGGTTITNGTIQVGNGGTTGSLGTGPISVQGSLVYDRSDAVTVANNISGSGTLTQLGAGTLILTGTNSYGATVISAGTLQVGNGGSSGTLGAGNVADNGTLAFNRSDDITISQIISGAGGVRQVGPNTVTLNGANTFTGPVSIGAGSKLKVVAANSIGATTGTVGSVTVANGGTFDLGAIVTANAVNFGTRVFHISGTGVGGIGAIANSGTNGQNNAFNFITLDADALIAGSRMDIGRSGANPVLDLQGHTLTVKMGGANNVVFGILSNTTVTGGNIVVANSGGTNPGALDIERSAIVHDDGSSTITFNPGTSLELFETASGAVTRKMIFQGNNFIGAGSTNLATLNSNLVIQGNVTLEASVSGVPTPGSNFPLLVAGDISESGGSFSVTKAGTNTVTLSGTNTYSGGTVINAGTLVVGSSTALPAASTLDFNGAAGTLDLAGSNATVAGLTNSAAGAAVVASSSATAPSTLTFAGNSTPSAFGGIIQNTIGSGTQTVALKVISGSLTLSGANTFSGGTSITGGTLIAANPSALGKGAVAIHAGGKLQLASSLGVNGLTFDGATNNWSGSLDLNGSHLVVEDSVTHATSFANLQNQARSVISSTGLPAGYGIAVLDNALLNKATFGGITVDSNAILVAPELLGDANADGTVNAADLNTVLTNFGAVTANWTSGNFDGAATIDLTDLAAVLNNFGQNSIFPNDSSGGAGPAIATPEPTSLALLGLGAAALLTRRRKA